MREGREQELRLTLGERAAETAGRGCEAGGVGGSDAVGGRLALSREPLTPESADQWRNARAPVVRERPAPSPVWEILAVNFLGYDEV